MITDKEQTAFLIAWQRARRKAFKVYLDSIHIDRSNEQALTTAEIQFKTVPLLHDPDLHSLSLQTLALSRGTAITTSSTLPMTVWKNGSTDVASGYAFHGTLYDFTTLLTNRSSIIAKKGRGWIIEPTTNKDGYRTNESTTHMHAVFLDCDGTGTWDVLLATLNAMNIAHVAYQSGGWSPSTPKWRIVLPLSAPFAVGDESSRIKWKMFYHCCRILLGSAANLLSEGFDAKTDAPSIPFFITEKRDQNDPPRQITWHEGYSLDASKIMSVLPEIAPDNDEQHDDISDPAHGPVRKLDDAHMEEIVSALADATSNIPRDRRDLYLALPGAMLDRGVDPDDVLAICEAVSDRYPRHHAANHADNVRCARTTISLWERGGDYTRIGTLQGLLPNVALALDRALPDPEREQFHALARWLACKDDAVKPLVPRPGTDDVRDWSIPLDQKTLRKFAVNLRRRKRKDDSIKAAIHWILLDRLLSKKALANPVEQDAEHGLNRDESIHRLMGLLAFKFPKNTPIDAILQMIHPSIMEMLGKGELPDKWLKMAERSYLLSLASRLEDIATKERELEATRAFSRSYALRGGTF